MAQDKLIKSGQLTFGRLLFLVVAGGAIVATVALGGVWLSIGYWVMTLGLCALLFFIAIDYGIRMDKVEYHAPSQLVAAAATVETVASEAAAVEAKARKRSTRSPKRRR